MQYFDCWADGVATNILMPHYNCRDGQQAQQCQRMRYQPSACATASLNPVKLISYLQVCVACPSCPQPALPEHHRLPEPPKAQSPLGCVLCSSGDGVKPSVP